MGTLKRLRKQCDALLYRVQIAEQRLRLAELEQASAPFGFAPRNGGKPSKSTPADQRLKRNNPNAGKPKPKTDVKKPFPGAAPPFKKQGA